MTKWSVQVSDETDQAVKAFLTEQEDEPRALSALVEQLVKKWIRQETIRRMKERNAQYDQQEIMNTVDEAVEWARVKACGAGQCAA